VGLRSEAPTGPPKVKISVAAERCLIGFTRANPNTKAVTAGRVKRTQLSRTRRADQYGGCNKITNLQKEARRG
jgi:hypothetical protein